MITDKDIIIELLRQREDLQAQVEENSEDHKCVNELNDIIAKLRADIIALEENSVPRAIEAQRNDLASVLKECNFPELRKLLNIPEGESLSTQLVKKVQELVEERDSYRKLMEERKAMYDKTVKELDNARALLRDRTQYGVYLPPDQTIKQPPKNQ